MNLQTFAILAIQLLHQKKKTSSFLFTPNLKCFLKAQTQGAVDITNLSKKMKVLSISSVIWTNDGLKSPINVSCPWVHPKGLMSYCPLTFLFEKGLGFFRCDVCEASFGGSCVLLRGFGLYSPLLQPSVSTSWAGVSVQDVDGFLNFLDQKSNLKRYKNWICKIFSQDRLFWASSSFPDTVGTVGRKHVWANKSS